MHKYLTYKEQLERRDQKRRAKYAQEQDKFNRDIRKFKEYLLTITKLSELIFSYTPPKSSRRGLFLISHKDKILIQIFPNNLHKNEKHVKSICYKEKYQYFSHVMGSDGREVGDEIALYMVEFKAFIEDRAEELNEKLPKSEEWFQDKIKKEDIFHYFGFEFNKPFKKFIYDGYSKKFNVVIEVDGSIHDTERQIIRDREKDRMTARYGYKIIRVKAFDEESYQNCVKELKAVLATPKKKPLEMPVKVRRQEKVQEFSAAVTSVDFNKKMPF